MGAEVEVVISWMCYATINCCSSRNIATPPYL